MAWAHHHLQQWSTAVYNLLISIGTYFGETYLGSFTQNGYVGVSGLRIIHITISLTLVALNLKGKFGSVCPQHRDGISREVILRIHSISLLWVHRDLRCIQPSCTWFSQPGDA
ncbi:hypothetical protein ABKN59_003496 [Abortiporus biennis]